MDFIKLAEERVRLECERVQVAGALAILDCLLLLPGCNGHLEEHALDSFKRYSLPIDRESIERTAALARRIFEAGPAIMKQFIDDVEARALALAVNSRKLADAMSASLVDKAQPEIKLTTDKVYDA